VTPTLESLLGRKVKIQHTPPRAGDVRHTQASIEKAQRLLGYNPTVGFEEGMRRTFEHWTRKFAQLATAAAAS
jgi:nucleoside-diphosphate-sugar epimerase